MPAELSVVGPGDPPELVALQDDWYQDVLPSEIGLLLKDGIEWASTLTEGRTGRFALSGRSLYVLARHRDLSGFVSTPRLILGEEHVVLCLQDKLSDVRAAIAVTESPEPIVLNSDIGIPDGWIGLRGVIPHRPVAPSVDGDILDALRPLADVEIALTGGIRIDRQTWLSGFPPTIRVRGDTSSIDFVLIDGQKATLTAQGSYVATAWDAPGEHSAWCTSSSRTYVIRSGIEEWEPWDAYIWSLGELSGADDRAYLRGAICGALVLAPGVARPDSRATVVPASNPLLIGARPGEITVCTPRGDVHAGFCVGFPWFDPVWAIPANPLHCDKRTARVLLIGAPRPPAGPATDRRRIRRWSTAIVAAGLKGLMTEPAGAEIAQLWKAYRGRARALRSRRR
jgi:hypothetical protein